MKATCIPHTSWEIPNQFLSQNNNEKRECCAMKLLNKPKHPFQSNMLWFFLDKTNFSQDWIVSTQTNRWLAVSQKHVPWVINMRYPVKIIALGVITSECDIFPPLIFPHDLKLNKDAPFHCPEELMLLRFKRVDVASIYVCQQKSAAWHTSKRIEALLSGNFCKHITMNI